MAIDRLSSPAQTKTKMQCPEGFVDRQRELGWLNDWIFDRAIRFICICGEGGVGKTWLARELACQAARKNVFHAVVWTTAKDKELVARSSALAEALGRSPRIRLVRSAMVPRSGVVQSLDALYAAIAVDSEHPDAKDIARSPAISREDILSWLRIRRILLVIDDLDGWGDRWADVINFAEAVRPPSVVLLTSRVQLNSSMLPGVAILSLGLLDNQYAEMLLAQLARERDISLDPKDRCTILDFAQGNPLMLRLAVGVVAKRTLTPGEIASTLKSAGRSATITQFLYDKIYSDLTTQARRIAMYFAIIHDEKLPESPPDRIGQICELRESLVYAAVEELRSVSLIDRDPGDQSKHDMHPLAVDFVISRDPDLHRRLRERIQQKE